MMESKSFSIPGGECEISTQSVKYSSVGRNSYLLRSFFDRRLAVTIPFLWAQGLVVVLGGGILFYFGQSLAGTVVGLLGIYLIGSWLAGGQGRTLEIPRESIQKASLHDGAPPVVPPFVHIEYQRPGEQQRSCRMPIFSDKPRHDQSVALLRETGILPAPKEKIDADDLEDDLWDEEQRDEEE